MIFTPREAKQIEAASRALAALPVRAPATALFDAIRPCAPAAAGTLGVLRPGAPDRMVSHAIRLPPDVFESWLRTPREVLARTLLPVIAAPAGGLARDSEAITGPLRERLTVLRTFDGAGLGEGAGYKILQRAVPFRGSEHFMLALIAERGEVLPHRAEAMLAALNPAIREAVLRTGLPLLGREPILAQIVEEQAIGYVCVTGGGAIVEANRRAHRLALRYREVAGIVGRRHALADLAARARGHASRGRTWYLPVPSPPSVLEVNVHRLAREAHALREDLLLVVLRESLSPMLGGGAPPALAGLTPRQREIAILIARTGLAYKQIAGRLGISEATVRTHAENVHRALGVHSRAELSVLLEGPPKPGGT